MNNNNCRVCGAPLNIKDEDKIQLLFNMWKRQPGEFTFTSLAERILCERLIKEWGYEKVKEAFIEAGSERERMKLSYVRGILRKENQKVITQRNVNESNEFKKELNSKTAGAGLPALTNLLKELNDKHRPKAAAVNDDYKKSAEYLRKKSDFENSLKERK